MRSKLLLLAVSLVSIWFLLEFVLFPFLIPFTPLRLHSYIPQEIRILAQSSKRSAVPQDYVGIIGDSYAQGLGDWLRATDPDTNGPFHSAHVVHELTGRDVITFGSGGAGSYAAVGKLISWLRYFELSRRYELAPPKTVLMYFYEGNDLHDTLFELSALSILREDPSVVPDLMAGGLKVLQLLDRRLPAVVSDARMYDESYLDSLMTAGLRLVQPRYRETDALPLLDELGFSRFLAAALVVEIPRLFRMAPDSTGWPTFKRPDLEILVRVDGDVVAIPGYLQSPGIELTPVETDLALHAFEQSIRFLRSHLVSSELCIVYIPSPITCYELVSAEVSVTSMRDQLVFPSATVLERSRVIQNRIEGISRRNEIGFVDAQPAIRSAAKYQLVHGPEDWRHFNRAGYTALAETAVGCLERTAPRAGANATPR
jgi:hypothetical protein